MSKTKFNGFEKYFITQALMSAIEQAEEDILEMNRQENKSAICIYLSLTTMIGETLIEKVNSMTQKKHQ